MWIQMKTLRHLAAGELLVTLETRIGKLCSRPPWTIIIIVCYHYYDGNDDDDDGDDDSDDNDGDDY